MEYSFKLGLVEQYVQGQIIYHIIPHARYGYLALIVRYLAILALFVLCHYGLLQFSLDLRWLMAIVGLALFAKFVYDFLDKYMDTAILTDKGITIVTIEGWFSYKVDFFERKNIASTRFTQDGLLAKIFNEGDIAISLDHDSDYTLEAVSRPQKQASIINKLKFESISREQEIAQQAQISVVDQPDKFEILVDTLGEVIGAYMRGK